MTNLTLYNEANEREVEMMVGKAMCAYANWMQAIDGKSNERAEYWTPEQQVSHERLIAMYASEYEATVRCIDLFVRENIYAIQRTINQMSEKELGIE